MVKEDKSWLDVLSCLYKLEDSLPYRDSTIMYFIREIEKDVNFRINTILKRNV